MNQFIMIPFDMARNTEFLKWSGTAEFKVWLNLKSYIVRRPNGNNMSKLLFNDFHRNGKLVARWNQRDIAKNVGLKSPGHVSDLLASMDRKGIIKKHKIPWNGRLLCVYEFGVYNKNTNMEIYHAYIHFRKRKAKEMLCGFGNTEFGFHEPII